MTGVLDPDKVPQVKGRNLEGRPMLDTSGIWFRGQQTGGLDKFLSPYEIGGDLNAQNGIYFSRCPWIAYCYATKKGPNGWIYAVCIHSEKSNLATGEGGYFGYWLKKAFTDELRSRGFDSVYMPGRFISPHIGQSADEIALFGPTDRGQVTIVERIAAPYLAFWLRTVRGSAIYRKSSLAIDADKAAQLALGDLYKRRFPVREATL